MLLVCFCSDVHCETVKTSRLTPPHNILQHPPWQTLTFTTNKITPTFPSKHQDSPTNIHKYQQHTNKHHQRPKKNTSPKPTPNQRPNADIYHEHLPANTNITLQCLASHTAFPQHSNKHYHSPPNTWKIIATHQISKPSLTSTNISHRTTSNTKSHQHTTSFSKHQNAFN